MMSTAFKHISCLFCSLLFSIMMQGQPLSSLGKAKEIEKGVLPNGISYYIVSNPSVRGFADFALVQPGVTDQDGARRSLVEQPVAGFRKPYRFLADHGIGYGPRGYISYDPESVRFDFRNVPVHDEAVADSTLMMIFGIAASDRFGQAVVVSGDVSSSKILERMKMFSLMVPGREKYKEENPYVWTPRDSLAFRITYNTTDDVAVINLIYSAERLARKTLDSAVPLVTSMYSSELGIIASKRLREAFRKENVPLADLRFRYSDSSAGPEDERYVFSVYTSAADLKKATAIVASVFASIDKNGVSKEELQDAKDRLVSEAVRKTKSSTLTNAEYVDKCVASYLYGTNLASEETINGFFSGRRLSGDRELGLFNGFAKALIDSTRNLTLRFDIPYGDVSRDDILPVFHSVWAKAGTEETFNFKADYGDTLSLYRPKSKVRLRSDIADPVSGGRLWTFSNGIKVVYKKVEGIGEFNYALLLRGGYADVPGLSEGEGAFVGDMLGVCDIAGMTGNDFKEMLLANGITMDSEASLSDLRISGIAPSGKINMVLRALLSVSSSRKINMDSFHYYRKGEAVRLNMGALSPRDVNTLMDDVLCPDYRYTDHKNIDKLEFDLPQRSETWFADQFSKVGDGVLALVGDLDEEVLKKILCRTLGDFKTEQKFAPRPAVSKKTINGTATRITESSIGLVGGGEIGVNAAMSAQMPFNLSNYMSFRVACDILEKELIRDLADQGAYAEVSEKYEMFPSERMTVYVNCKPCFANGLPEGVRPADPLDLLEVVRFSLGKTATMKVSSADVAAYKSALQKEIESAAGLPRTVISNVMVRYGEGKDVVSGWKDAVSSVTAEKVSAVLAALSGGAGVEYVIL